MAGGLSSNTSRLMVTIGIPLDAGSPAETVLLGLEDDPPRLGYHLLYATHRPIQLLHILPHPGHEVVVPAMLQSTPPIAISLIHYAQDFVIKINY